MKHFLCRFERDMWARQTGLVSKLSMIGLTLSHRLHNISLCLPLIPCTRRNLEGTKADLLVLYTVNASSHNASHQCHYILLVPPQLQCVHDAAFCPTLLPASAVWSCCVTLPGNVNMSMYGSFYILTISCPSAKNVWHIWQLPPAYIQKT